LSAGAAHRAVEGFVIQPNVIKRDLSLADTILKQEQVDARSPDYIGPKRSEQVRIGERIAETGS